MTADPAPTHPERDRLARLESIGRGVRLRLHTDGGIEEVVAAAVVQEHGLGVGDPLDAATLASLRRTHALWETRQAALRLLSARAWGTVELERRLRRRGHDEDVVASCVARLTREGLLDDEAYAGAFVRDRLARRPRGRRRLLAELRGRGVADETAARAVAAALATPGRGEPELARDAVERWLRRQPPRIVQALGDPTPTPEGRRAHRRLYAHLARSGFASESIAGAVEHARRRSHGLR